MVDEKTRRRLQLDLTEKAFERLNQIRSISGFESYAEVVRTALRLYGWFLDQHRNGWRLQLVKGTHIKDVELLMGEASEIAALEAGR